MHAIIALLLLSGFNSRAQSEPLWHPVYDQYTVKDDLPSMEFYYSFQDKEGYMWFASDRGVVRYNGDKFQTFTTEDGLMSNTVFKISLLKQLNSKNSSKIVIIRTFKLFPIY